ncbi:MAG: hypothetical protein IT329_21820 [Caldilineaceae bacterium]|nr:hypothetical protein [Caldilineaceae bacterium]
MYTQTETTEIDGCAPIYPSPSPDLVNATRNSAPAARTPARPRHVRRRLPGTALLARLVDDPALAPDWLQVGAAALGSAGRPDRGLSVRLLDVADLLAQLDRLYTARLAEVQQWFDSPAAAGCSLPATLPVWTETLFAEAGALMHGGILPEMAAMGTQILPMAQVDEAQRAWLQRHFMQHIYPLLTPLAVDPGRPFPFISSDSLNLLVELRRPEAAREARTTLFARVKIPSRTARLVAIPPQIVAHTPGAKSGPQVATYVYSADLVRFFVHELFPGVPVRHVYLFRVLRGETPWPDVARRGAGRYRRQEDRPAVRLDVERRMAEPVLRWLAEHLQIPPHGVIHHDGLLEISGLPAVARLADGAAASGVRPRLLGIK